MTTDFLSIDFLLKAFDLKDEKRAGWLLRGVTDPESVADHSWGTAMFCWLYAGQEQVDRDRAISMALVHDIAEAEMGDVATRAHPDEQTMSADEKRRREREAFGVVASLLPSPAARDELVSLWEEYEAAKTATARFVRDMNLCDMCAQALLYTSNRRSTSRLDEFFETSRPRLSTATGKRLHRQIEERYRALR